LGGALHLPRFRRHHNPPDFLILADAEHDDDDSLPLVGEAKGYRREHAQKMKGSQRAFAGPNEIHWIESDFAARWARPHSMR
jgi:hypothetical protein